MKARGHGVNVGLDGATSTRSPRSPRVRGAAPRAYVPAEAVRAPWAAGTRGPGPRGLAGRVRPSSRAWWPPARPWRSA